MLKKSLHNKFSMNLYKNLKIYIVDDDIFCLNIYEQKIKNFGFKYVKTFSNGIECIGSIENDKPDLVFLDYDLEDMKGIDILKILKKELPNTYVIMLSGQDNIYVAIEAVKNGAFEYIVKNDQDMEKITNVLNKISRVKNTLQKLEKWLVQNINNDTVINSNWIRSNTFTLI